MKIFFLCFLFVVGTLGKVYAGGKCQHANRELIVVNGVKVCKQCHEMNIEIRKYDEDKKQQKSTRIDESINAVDSGESFQEAAGDINTPYELVGFADLNAGMSQNVKREIAQPQSEKGAEHPYSFHSGVNGKAQFAQLSNAHVADLAKFSSHLSVKPKEETHKNIDVHAAIEPEDTCYDQGGVDCNTVEEMGNADEGEVVGVDLKRKKSASLTNLYQPSEIKTSSRTGVDQVLRRNSQYLCEMIQAIGTSLEFDLSFIDVDKSEWMEIEEPFNNMAVSLEEVKCEGAGVDCFPSIEEICGAENDSFYILCSLETISSPDKDFLDLMLFFDKKNGGFCIYKDKKKILTKIEYFELIDLFNLLEVNVEFSRCQFSEKKSVEAAQGKGEKFTIGNSYKLSPYCQRLVSLSGNMRKKIEKGLISIDISNVFSQNFALKDLFKSIVQVEMGILYPEVGIFECALSRVDFCDLDMAWKNYKKFCQVSHGNNMEKVMDKIVRSHEKTKENGNWLTFFTHCKEYPEKSWLVKQPNCFFGHEFHTLIVRIRDGAWHVVQPLTGSWIIPCCHGDHDVMLCLFNAVFDEQCFDNIEYYDVSDMSTQANLESAETTL